MTLETLFLMVVPTYLVLVGYGQVGARRHGLSARMRLLAGALRVTIPPAVLILALLSTGDTLLTAAWRVVTLGMAIAGGVVAVLTEVIAQRIGA